MNKIQVWTRGNVLSIRDDHTLGQNDIFCAHLFTVLANDGINWTWNINLHYSNNIDKTIKNKKTKFNTRQKAQQNAVNFFNQNYFRIPKF